MKEKTLLKLALITTIVGLGLLFVISESSELEPTALEKIDGLDVGAPINVLGTVESYYVSGDFMLITISQPSETTIVVYENLTDIAQGKQIEVIGRIDQYEGENQVIADRIRIIS